MKSIKHLLLCLVLLGAASCGGGDSAATNANTLHRGLSTDPETLDAHKARSTQAADVLRDIGEGLTSYAATGELTNGAAEHWDISDDRLTYTFTLRPGLKWSNGDALTAEHFVYSIERLTDPATGAVYAQYLSDVAGAEAVDDRTLVITLRRPTLYLLDLLTHPATFPMHPGSVAEHGDGFARPGKLLSNGAYVLSDWVPGSVIALSRNELYWNNAATAIDEVRHHVVTEETTELARYRAGEIDITSTVPPDNFQQTKAQLGDQLHISPYLGVYYYGFNVTKPPFKDNPELRQALSMAIDRELIVEKVMGRGEMPAYSWTHPGVTNYDPPEMSFEQLSQTERNQIAKSLYKAAGYDDENPLRIEIRYNTSDTQQRVALAIQSMWRDVLGVETELINEEFQVLLANIRARRNTQVFRASWIGDYDDAHALLSILQSNNSANMPGYASDEFDDLMERAANQVDADSRRLFLEEAERLMLADHPTIPIYFYVSKHLVSPRVVGWGDSVLNYHYSQHLSLKAAE